MATLMELSVKERSKELKERIEELKTEGVRGNTCPNIDKCYLLSSALREEKIDFREHDYYLLNVCYKHPQACDLNRTSN